MTASQLKKIRATLAIAPDQAGAESRRLLVSWGKLHNVRTLLGLASMLLFAWALASIG